MSIPLQSPTSWEVIDPDKTWSELTPAAKHERILCAAGRVFGTRGLDASMPSVAVAAGAGVASVYRQFPSKWDLLAALVTRRLEQIQAAAAQAAAAPGSRWDALTDMLRTVVELQSCDDFLGDAFKLVSGHPDVVDALARASAELERLLGAARAEGRLRADATAGDVWLVLRATRAARELEPGACRRMLMLLIGGLEAVGLR